MASAIRRIDIRELGDATCALVREIHDSGDEVVLVDGSEEMVVLKPSISSNSDEGLHPEWDDWDPADREAWKNLLAIRRDVTQHWASNLSAAEAIAEQRR